MLYICIPAYNEAPTIGVLLWRIRKVLRDFSREYEIVVFDDGSTDATGETLQPYGDVLPLSVLGGERHVGYAGALDALCRAVVAKTRYPRRDAMLVMTPLTGDCIGALLTGDPPPVDISAFSIARFAIGS